MFLAMGNLSHFCNLANDNKGRLNDLVSHDLRRRDRAIQEHRVDSG